MATNNNINYGPATLPGTVPTPVLGNNIDRAPAPVAPGAGTGYVPTVTQPVRPVTEQPVINPPIVVARTAVVLPVAEQPVAEVVAESTAGPNIPASNQQRYLTILANGSVVTDNASSLDFEGNGFTITSSGPYGAVITLSGAAGYGNSNVSTFLAAFGSNTLSTTGNITGNYFIGNGSQLTGIVANTGNVTFNNQAVVGTGDQQGASGLYLAPGIQSVGNLQYLRVRGGDLPTHIHLDTGNNTYFDQYFGDDNKYVKLANTGNIVINTNNLVDASAQWTFGTDGKLNLPGANADYTIATQSGYITVGNLLIGQGGSLFNSNNDSWALYGNISDPGTSISIPSDAAAGNGTPLYLENQISNVEIRSGSGTWNFDTTGTLTVPAANGVPGQILTQTTVANEKGFDLRITAGNTDGCTRPGGDMYLSAGVGYNGISHGAGNVNIVTGDRYGNVTGNIWRFDSSGALTLPLGSATIKNTAGNAVAFGLNAGLTSQGANAVAIGINSGVYSQSASAVAIGTLAGNGGRVTTNYVSGAVSPSTTLVVTSTTGIVPGMVITGTGFFGTITVVTVTNSTTLEISASAVFTPSGALNFTGSQGDNSVAIGTQAGQVQQGQFAVSIGDNAGNSGQGTDAVAIGASAGLNTQGAGAVAFGQGTGETSQGANAVAIGKAAGQVNQGINSIAIGQSAGLTNQGNNSIVLNATGAALDQTTANTFTVAPVRNDVANIGNVMFYNATSKEITYGNVISVTGNITGNYILGNGSQLTSINAVTVDITDTNGLTTVYYPTFVENRTTAQIARADVDLTYRTDDNLLTVGNVSVTGNITGGNVLGGANVNATTHTGTTVSVTANVTGGNLISGALTSTASLSVTGNTATITTANYSIGYLNVPQVSLAANATIALTDSGKHYYSVSASNLALTIANNTSVSWSVGTAITIVNAGTANILINQGTGVSMYQAGNATSGNRVLATFGMATIMNTAANVWFINGTGLT